MFEKNLTDLVRGIRNNKSNEVYVPAFPTWAYCDNCVCPRRGIIYSFTLLCLSIILENAFNSQVKPLIYIVRGRTASNFFSFVKGNGNLGLIFLYSKIQFELTGSWTSLIEMYFISHVIFKLMVKFMLSSRASYIQCAAVLNFVAKLHYSFCVCI